MKSVYGEDKSACCGCGVCRQVCPKAAIIMRMDDEGFLYPQINKQLCIDCGLCRRSCPIIQFQKPETPHRYVIAAKHQSRAVLRRSSSGGMFTAFSDAVLQERGTVYGCAYDKDFNLIYYRAQDSIERNRLCGSKYIQSDLRDSFPQIRQDLKEGLSVCFTGVPCQCAALYTYLYNIDTSRLLTLSLVCHGAPSPKLFHDYLSYCNQIRKGRIVTYEHRPKHRHWGHIERAAFIYENGDSDSDSVLSQGWKWLFYSNAALRPCCYQCPWSKYGHFSDVTIGDFWGIEDCMPDFYDPMGVSLVLINTEYGEYVFKKISHNLEFRFSSFENAIQKNPNLISPSVPLTDRERFWQLYRTKGFPALIYKYGHINSYYYIKNFIRRVVMKFRFRE